MDTDTNTNDPHHRVVHLLRRALQLLDTDDAIARKYIPAPPAEEQQPTRRVCIDCGDDFFITAELQAWLDSKGFIFKRCTPCRASRRARH
jgi:hypothetical protein